LVFGVQGDHGFRILSAVLSWVPCRGGDPSDFDAETVTGLVQPGDELGPTIAVFNPGEFQAKWPCGEMLACITGGDSGGTLDITTMELVESDFLTNALTDPRPSIGKRIAGKVKNVKAAFAEPVLDFEFDVTINTINPPSIP